MIDNTSPNQMRQISGRPVFVPNALRLELQRIERVFVEKKRKRERAEWLLELSRNRQARLASESFGRRLLRKMLNVVGIVSVLLSLFLLLDYLMPSQTLIVWSIWYDLLYYFPADELAGPF